MITFDRFCEACQILQLSGVTEFRCTPELFVALSQESSRRMECLTGELGTQFMSPDGVIETKRVPYYRGMPFRLAKEFK